jgi:hypothetical protein
VKSLSETLIQQTNSAFYSLRSGLSNEMSLDKPLHLKKKVSGRCALPGGHKQKSYAPKYGQGKTILDLFRDFLEKTPMSKLFLCVNAFPWNRIFFF